MVLCLGGFAIVGDVVVCGEDDDNVVMDGMGVDDNDCE